MAESLSAEEGRRLALRAQGLLGAPDRRRGVPGVLADLGAVQLDTISVLARSHELVAYARLGPVGRAAVEAAYWGPTRQAFEYWSHAACILPMELWPWFAFRRRRYADRGVWRRSVPPADIELVLDRIRDDGPLTSSDLGGAKRSGEGWWDWSASKVAIEHLLAAGRVVCAERRSWKRVYDLPERVVPPGLAALEPTDAECFAALAAAAGRRLGVATVKDLADWPRLKQVEVEAALDASGLVPVSVEGWGSRSAWADPAALDELATGGLRGLRPRTALLSPFDSLVWDRARTERVFGVAHRLEAYTPKAKRLHGYFAMHLLAGGGLVGKVDPAREGRTLVARHVALDRPSAVGPAVDALREAAAWVGCDDVRVERVTPPALADRLRSAFPA